VRQSKKRGREKMQEKTNRIQNKNATLFREDEGGRVKRNAFEGS
jgi:hypothetical protein